MCQYTLMINVLKTVILCFTAYSLSISAVRRKDGAHVGIDYLRGSLVTQNETTHGLKTRSKKRSHKLETFSTPNVAYRQYLHRGSKCCKCCRYQATATCIRSSGTTRLCNKKHEVPQSSFISFDTRFNYVKLATQQNIYVIVK